MTNRQIDQHEIEDMRPVAWKADGTPTRFEIVQREPRPQPRVIGADDDVQHIVSPMPVEYTPRVQHIVQSDAVNEARGFNIRVSSLAAVLGGGAVLAAMVFGASLSFWSALMWFGTVFALTWPGAFVLDAMRSPGGIELFHTWHLWRFLHNEQRYRHDRYARPKSDRRRGLEAILFAAAVGATVLAGLAMLAAVFMENVPR